MSALLMRKENFLKEKTSLSCFLFNFPFPLLVVVAKVQNISFTSRTSEVFCTLSTKRLMSLGSCLFLFFCLCLLKLGVIGFCILQSDYRICQWKTQCNLWLRKTIFMLLSRQSIIWLSLKDWDLSLGVSHAITVLL